MNQQHHCKRSLWTRGNNGNARVFYERGWTVKWKIRILNNLFPGNRRILTPWLYLTWSPSIAHCLLDLQQKKKSCKEINLSSFRIQSFLSRLATILVEGLLGKLGSKTGAPGLEQSLRPLDRLASLRPLLKNWPMQFWQFFSHWRKYSTRWAKNFRSRAPWGKYPRPARPLLRERLTSYYRFSARNGPE